MKFLTKGNMKSCTKDTITLRTSTGWGLTNWKAALQEKPWGSGGQVEHETGCALVVKKGQGR